MTRPLLSLVAALALVTPAIAQEEETQTFPSPNEIVDQATPEDWVTIPTSDLMVMTLAPDAEGNPRQVVIQLMPAPFSQGWIENIKTLTRSGYYDGLSVIRVQDNYVTQWGDPSEEEEDAKPLPEGLKVIPETDYTSNTHIRMVETPRSETYAMLRERDGRRFESWVPADVYAKAPFSDVGFKSGWPIASDETHSWPTHCYGMVGVARGMSPNTGDGSSLYTVIGHAPRHLDRNIALVGRVIEGMEHLSSLPRGKGTLGFYAEEEADKRTAILSVKIASDMDDTSDYQFEYLSTESEVFAKYADARANRRDPFFIVPAGGADICNIPVPIRKVDPADAAAE